MPTGTPARASTAVNIAPSMTRSPCAKLMTPVLRLTKPKPSPMNA